MMLQIRKPSKLRYLPAAVLLLLSCIFCLAAPKPAFPESADTVGKEYTLTYYLDGGKNAPENPDGFDADTKTFDLKDPEKQHGVPQ